jgi:hypothetical protein
MAIYRQSVNTPLGARGVLHEPVFFKAIRQYDNCKQATLTYGTGVQLRNRRIIDPCDTSLEDLNMLVQDAQREVRTVFVGGFWGQLVSSALWLVSAALGTWKTPHAAIFSLVFSGFFIFPITQLLLRSAGGPASLTRGNPLGNLGMQIAFTLPMCMLLLVPVTAFRLNWFYPGLLILVGAHYLPFTFLYGMRMFIPLCAVLVGGGVVIALYFSGSFSLGGWVGGVTLFIFAWILRASVQTELHGEG